MSDRPTLTPHIVRGGPGTGAIAAGSRGTAQAGAEVLAKGGNAVDAAFAAAIACGISELAFASLGGGGFLALRWPDGRTAIRDFFVNTPGIGLSSGDLVPHFVPMDVIFPGTVQRFHLGRGSVAVPGMISGIIDVQRELGSLPLAEVVAPATRMAREGVELEAVQASTLSLIAELIGLTAESRALIEFGDGLLEAGDPVRNPALAGFLDRLADGTITGLSSPALAQPLLDGLADGGLITRQDLDAYRVLAHRPLEVTRSGSRIHTNPRPSFGGSIIADVLRKAPRLDAPPAWAGMARALVDATAAQRAVDVASGHSEVRRGTTHLSVVDSAGLVASLTLSNGTGAGVVIPGMGIFLNNMLGEDDLNPGGFHASPPGVRMGSMMSPSIVELPDGSAIGLGTGGSERIRSALSNVILRLVDRGEDLPTAVAAPRVHAMADGFHAEAGLDEEVYQALESVNRLTRWNEPSIYFGGVHSVQRWPDGRTLAVADGRRGGHAIVV